MSKVPREELVDPCAIGLGLELIGGKWKGQLIWWIKDQPRRFNELRGLLPGITQRTLINQLRELVRDGLVTRTQYEEIPPRVEYSATPLCLTLIPLLDRLSEWAEENSKSVARARRRYDQSVEGTAADK